MTFTGNFMPKRFGAGAPKTEPKKPVSGAEKAEKKC